MQAKKIINWPARSEVNGFELHYGESTIINSDKGSQRVSNLFVENSLGWVLKGEKNNFIAGTYLHGIFENSTWRRQWINEIRVKKGLNRISTDGANHIERRERTLNSLADIFEKKINLKEIL